MRFLEAGYAHFAGGLRSICGGARIEGALIFVKRTPYLGRLAKL